MLQSIGSPNAGALGDTGSIPRWRRSFGGRRGNPFSPEEYPWTKEPGRLQSIGSQRVRHKESDRIEGT